MRGTCRGAMHHDNHASLFATELLFCRILIAAARSVNPHGIKNQSFLMRRSRPNPALAADLDRGLATFPALEPAPAQRSSCNPGSGSLVKRAIGSPPVRTPVTTSVASDSANGRRANHLRVAGNEGRGFSIPAARSVHLLASGERAPGNCGSRTREEITFRPLEKGPPSHLATHLTHSPRKPA